LPNPASVALHEAIGMRRIGVYEGVGSKVGAWHDGARYGLPLAEPGLPLAEPGLPLAEPGLPLGEPVPLPEPL
jgi:phosphinothricin acetyltransferase